MGETKGPENAGPGDSNGGWDQLQALIAIAGGLVGLAAYIYLLGGLVLWLKLRAAQLPSEDAMRVLDRNRLLTVGLKALAFEVVVIGGIFVLAVITWSWFRDSKNKQDPKWYTWKLLLHGAIVMVLAGAVLGALFDPSLGLNLALALVVAVAWLGLVLPQLHDWLPERQSPERVKWALKTALTVVAAILALVLLAAPAGVLVLVLLIFLHLSHHLKDLVEVRNVAALVPAVLGMGAAVSLVVAVYLATPPVSFDRATVYLKNGKVFRGGYVGQSDEGVFLVGCSSDPVDPRVSTHVKLRIVPTEAVRRTRLVEKRFVVDYGKNPSLVDIGWSLLQRDPVEDWPGTVSVDVRGPELACGHKRSIQLLSGRSRRTDRSLERIEVLSKGSVELTGRQFRTQTRHVEKATSLKIPLAPNRTARITHRCGGMIRGLIDVRFSPAYGESEHRKTVVERRVRRWRTVRCPRPFVHRAHAVNAR